MHFRPRFPRPPAARRSIWALSFAALVVPVSILLLSASGSTATPSSSYAAYPALNSTAPTELELVSSHSTTRTGERPTWPLQAPQGAHSGTPLAESIRKLEINEPNMTAWIAKSLGGGICVLVWAHQPAGVTPSIGTSCSSETEEGLARGATAQISDIPGEPGRVFVGGVVPSTVGSVTATLANGSSKTVPVYDNAWSIETEGEPRGYTNNPVGG
jgi:hypothetical protein